MSVNPRNRPVLQAKRRNERADIIPRLNKPTENSDNRQGLKRILPQNSNQRNLANDRMKRLRTALNDEAKQTTVKELTTKPYNNKHKLSRDKQTKKTVKRGLKSETDVTNVKIVKRSEEKFEFSSSRLLVRPQFSFSNNNNNETVFNFGNKSEPTTTNLGFVASVSDVRKSPNEMEWSDDSNGFDTQNKTETQSIAQTTTTEWSKTTDKNAIYIVVDTNILISQLSIVEDIVKMNINNHRSYKPIIYVPWMVIEELDYMKGGNYMNSIKKSAQKAITSIHEMFEENSERIIGQTLDEANNQRNVGKSPDNKIISCLLQVSEKYEKVILLTDDVNVRNKAMFNKISACSSRDIYKKIQNYSINKFQRILDTLKTLFINVIEVCAKNAYGNVWNRMDLLRDKPKTLQDCINIFQKYWRAVFDESLLKQCKKLIDEDLTKLLNSDNNSSDNIDELARLSVRLCLFFKDIEQCKGLVEKTIRDINSIRES